MATTEWKSDFVESFVNVGIEKGLEQGIGRAGNRALSKAPFRPRPRPSSRSSTPAFSSRRRASGDRSRRHRPRPTRPVVRPGADRRHRRRGLRGLTRAHPHPGRQPTRIRGSAGSRCAIRVVQHAGERVGPLPSVERRGGVGQRDRRGGDALGGDRQRGGKAFRSAPGWPGSAATIAATFSGTAGVQRVGARRATRSTLVPAVGQGRAAGERHDVPGAGGQQQARLGRAARGQLIVQRRAERAGEQPVGEPARAVRGQRIAEDERVPGGPARAVSALFIPQSSA